MTFDGIASTQYFSTQVSGTRFQGTSGTFTQLDGTTVGGTNITVTGSITDAVGRLRSAGVGSVVTYGAFVQAGSVATTAGSTGTITFGTNFAGSVTYFLCITPGSNALANAGVGSTVPYTSAITRSGANIVGAASTVYNWIAAGL